MAISVKLLRTGSAATQNTFVVTAGTGDSGKLQIQYNSSDVYNNLSGSTSYILSGASNNTIYIPLNDSKQIPKGEYYFNFVADVGTSDTSTVNFQVDQRATLLVPEVDVYEPSFRIDDDTSYTVDNGTVSAATRSLTVQYPQTSNQSNISASAADTTTSLYVTTSNVWTGAMQTTLSYDVTYTIAATTSYDTFTYQESGLGYSTENINGDTQLEPLYSCINALRVQVDEAASKKRSSYADLLTKYTYVMSLVTQYREGVYTNNTAALEDIIQEIKDLTNCTGSNSSSNSSASVKIYGIGGSSESIEDVVSGMFTSGTQYGVEITYNDTAGTLSLENRALFLNVYNDTGSTLSKGKAVYVTGYDATSGLPEVSLASNASAASAKAVGLVYADIASATSGRALVHGWFEEVNTSSFSVGDRLFLSTSGNLTATEPASTQNAQLIGTVLESATAGQMLVHPQKSVNFETSISTTTTIANIEANMSKVTLELEAGQIETLDTSSIEILAGTSGRVITIHSALVYITTVPSAGTQNIDFAIMADTAGAAAYSASKTIAKTNGISSSVANSAGVNASYQVITYSPDPAVAHLTAGDGLYLSNADNVGTYSDWASAVAKVVVFYSQFTV